MLYCLVSLVASCLTIVSQLGVVSTSAFAPSCCVPQSSFFFRTTTHRSFWSDPQQRQAPSCLVSARKGTADIRERKTTTATRLHAIVPEPKPLIPERNPLAAVDGGDTASSKSGVPYAAVRAGLDMLCPPHELNVRTALSRSDGYWPYVRKGKDPPEELTYGEFDLDFFATLLDWACSNVTTTTGDDDNEIVFVDVGSGTGRLVFAAAALHPSWKECRGIELLPSLHKAAVEHAHNLRSQDGGFALPTTNTTATNDDDDDKSHDEKVGGTRTRTRTRTTALLPMAPVDFVCGSFLDPYVFFGDANIIFVFSTCLSPESLEGFAQSVGRQCKPGTLVITTDYSLPFSQQGTVPPHTGDGDDRLPSGPFQLELLDTVQGWSWITGGGSTAFIHRVKTSPYAPETRGPWERPKVSVRDMCHKVAMAMEAGTLADTETFLRGVYNNMVFYEFPERWYARLRDRLCVR